MQIVSPFPTPQAGAYQKLFAGGAADPGAPAPTPSLGDDPDVKAILDYANMTPAQKMRAAILGKMGVSDADLAKMSPEERAKIEQKIKDAVKQAVQQSEQGDQDHKGMLVDMKA